MGDPARQVPATRPSDLAEQSGAAEQQRLGLLSRTVDELRRSCGEGRPEVLADHCRELASFAAGFDGCRGACAALVRRELTPVPTR